MNSERWHHIDSILRECLDHDPAGRQQILDRACEGDHGLRQEVEKLLAFDDHGATHVISVAVQAAAAGWQTSVPPARGLGLAEGDRIGAYRIVREIGRGGMGTVYLAERDDQHFHKQVAIKLVTRGMDTAALLDRFRRERQILARLEHPYIARLLDGGTAPDGRPYLVMEYVEGRPIAAYAAEHRLGTRRLIELFVKVCAAVHCAHQNLVVHRDLKPGNILVDSHGSPRLLDFGIAKLLGPDDTAQWTITQGGRLLTPDYASPEQVRGGPITTGSDIYSLGAILYELLAGVRPHRLRDYTAIEIERAVCQDDPVRPSTAARQEAAEHPGTAPPALSADLDNIVLMAMQKDPARRYGSAAEFSDDLQRFLDGLPVRARQDTVFYRTAKFIRRHRALVAAAVLLVASLTGGIAISSVQAHRARLERQRAEQRLSQIVDLANRALIDVHTSIETLPGATGARRRLLEITVSYLDQLASDSGHDARVQLALASAYTGVGEVKGYPGRPNIGDAAGALQAYRKADAILSALAGHEGDNAAYLLRSAQVCDGTSSILYILGKPDESLSEARRGLNFITALLAREPGNLEGRKMSARLDSALLEVLHERDPAAADRYLSDRMPAYQKLLDEYPKDPDVLFILARAHSHAGITSTLQHQVERSRQEYSAAIDLLHRELELRPFDVIVQRELMKNYSHLADVTSSPEERSAYLHKAVAAAESLSAGDPANQMARVEVAMIYVHVAAVPVPPSQIPESLRLLDKSEEILSAMRAASPENARLTLTLASVNSIRGDLYLRWHHYAEALRYYQAAADQAGTLAAAATGTYADTAEVECLAAVGRLQAILGRKQEAAATAARIVAEGRRIASGWPVYIPRSLQFAGDIHAAMADWRLATDYYAKAETAWGAVPEATREHYQTDVRENSASLVASRHHLTP